jgi:2-dehydro-3-deoxygalactonokinase
MRGEELQLLGLASFAPKSSSTVRESPPSPSATGVDGDARRAPISLVCIPGTHSKWITLEGAVVEEFRTAMTGEVFAAVTEHTLFAQLIQHDSAGTASLRASAFDRGLGASNEPHGVLNALFAFRAGVLLGRHDAADLPDLISGLLIGTEIRHAQAHAAGAREVAVIGASGLSERYAHALRAFSFEPRAFDPREVAARGFAALANG